MSNNLLTIEEKKNLLVPGAQFTDQDNIYKMPDVDPEPIHFIKPEKDYKPLIRWLSWLIVIIIIVLIFIYLVGNLNWLETCGVKR